MGVWVRHCRKLVSTHRMHLTLHYDPALISRYILSSTHVVVQSDGREIFYKKVAPKLQYRSLISVEFDFARTYLSPIQYVLANGPHGKSSLVRFTSAPS